MKVFSLLVFAVMHFGALAFAMPLESHAVPFDAITARDSIVLKNDGFNETGGNAYLQLGFITGEKAGIWVRVPESVSLFKVDAFRVLIDGSRDAKAVFFSMAIAHDGKYTTSMIPQIQNVAQVTPGPYWNDIPATGADGSLGCAKGGMLVGAALEFTHDGAPSVHRSEKMQNPLGNLIFAIPGGWNLSTAYGVSGDWILRIVGHTAAASECP